MSRSPGSGRLFGGVVFLLFALPGAMAATRGGDAQVARIDALRQEFNRAYSSADARALGALLTEDAVWMPPGHAEIAGRDAIVQHYATQFAATRSQFSLEPGEVRVSANQAVLQGPYRRTDTPADGGPPTTVVGKYLMVLERENGGWKIARDIWNLDTAPLEVDARVALNDFRALTEARLQEVQRTLSVLSCTPQAQSGDWKTMAGLLRSLSNTGILANAIWFARPDGSYYTVEKGLTGLSLADRSYFPGLMGGEPVVGVLVKSLSTGERSVIVAQPVRKTGRVIGALGVSYSVDLLSQELGRQMRLPANAVFYALDGAGETALHRDESLMFQFPSDFGDKSLQAAVKEMLSQESGAVEYDFQGMHKTVLFERSDKLGWVFALGFEAPVAKPLH